MQKEGSLPGGPGQENLFRPTFDKIHAKVVIGFTAPEGECYELGPSEELVHIFSGGQEKEAHIRTYDAHGAIKKEIPFSEWKKSKNQPR